MEKLTKILKEEPTDFHKPSVRQVACFQFGDGACQSAITFQVKDIGATPIFHTMNDEQTLSFAYICGKQHGQATITTNQYNQILRILYG